MRMLHDLRRHLAARLEPGWPALRRRKRWAVDFAVERCGLGSLADLGGVWAVDGGYAFYAATKGVEVTLVDTGITDAVRERAAGDRGVDLVEGDFRDPRIADRVGEVEGVLLFDVLLHQVAPDWDTVLREWAGRCRCLVIAQPCWRGDDTVRLLDLGPDRYDEVVPDRSYPHDLFDRLGEIHPRYGVPWREVHEIWQWGITGRDLDRVAREEGFRRLAYVDDGRWGGLDGFTDLTMVYARRG